MAKSLEDLTPSEKSELTKIAKQARIDIKKTSGWKGMERLTDVLTEVPFLLARHTDVAIAMAQKWPRSHIPAMTAYYFKPLLDPKYASAKELSTELVALSYPSNRHLLIKTILKSKKLMTPELAKKSFDDTTLDDFMRLVKVYNKGGYLRNNDDLVEYISEKCIDPKNRGIIPDMVNEFKLITGGLPPKTTTMMAKHCLNKDAKILLHLFSNKILENKDNNVLQVLIIKVSNEDLIDTIKAISPIIKRLPWFQNLVKGEMFRRSGIKETTIIEKPKTKKTRKPHLQKAKRVDTYVAKKPKATIKRPVSPVRKQPARGRGRKLIRE